MLKSIPKSLIFFHKKKKQSFSAKIYKSNFSAKIQCVIFRNRNFFPCKKSTVAISARKFKYLISNFPQKSTVAVLANFDAQIQMREIFLILVNFGGKIQNRDFSNILIFKSKLLLSQCHIFVLNFLHTVVVKSPCLSLAL